MRGPIEIALRCASPSADRAGRPASLPPLRGLTRNDFEALLARLAPDREEAGALYEDIRRRLVWLFGRQLGVESESVADEAIDRVARRLAEGADILMERPFGYFWSVARHVAQERLRQRQRERQAFEAQASASGQPEPEPDVDPRLACLQRCLRRLPANQRRLILHYYEDDQIRGRRRLARKLGIRINALRIRAHRTRRELEGCCARCLADPPSRPQPRNLAIHPGSRPTTGCSINSKRVAMYRSNGLGAALSPT